MTNNEAEEWKPVLDHRDGEPTGYEVSSLGRVRSVHKGFEGRILKGGEGPGNPSTAYRTVWVSDAYRTGSRRPRVDALVARAFLGEKPEGAVLRHLNGQEWDDRADNLAWEDTTLTSEQVAGFVKPNTPSVEQAKAIEKMAWEAVQAATRSAVEATRVRAELEALEMAQRAVQRLGGVVTPGGSAYAEDSP